MPDPYELVVNLLLFGLQLHLVGQWLPLATSADSEMAAERFQTVFRRGHHPCDESLHIILLFLRNLHIHNVSRHCELHEQNRAVNPCNSLALSRNRLNPDILKDNFLFLSSHSCSIFEI